MIRQTFSCDICGADKKESNHWFVAMEHDGEIRIGTWAALGRRRRGALHLCGQKCLYKLVDDFFIRRAPGIRTPVEVEAETPTFENSPVASSETAPAYDEWESSARLIPTPDKPNRINRDAAPAAPGRAAKSATQAVPDARRSAAREPASRESAVNSLRKPVRDRVAASAVRVVRTRPAGPDGSHRRTSQERVAPVQHFAAVTIPAPTADFVGRSYFAGEAVTAIAPAAHATEPIRAGTPVRAIESAPSAKPCVEAKSVPSARPSSTDRRSASAWQRERAREQGAVASSTRSGTVATSSRLVPNRIESRLHPILRPRALEA